VFQGDVSIVKKILESGADVNVRSQSGKTPLNLARHKSNNELMRLLISYGAYIGEESARSLFPDLIERAAVVGDFQIICERGGTPAQLSQALIFAVGQRKVDIVKILIARQVHCYPALQHIGFILKQNLMPHVRKEYQTIQELLSAEQERWERSLKQPVAQRIT
jgi:hypothetical protein